MKQRICSLIVLWAVLVFAGVILYRNGNFVAYLLAYIFSFVFLLCYMGLSPTSARQKIILGVVDALLLAAQILFAVLVLRPDCGREPAIALCRLFGVIIIPVPFLVHQLWRAHE